MIGASYNTKVVKVSANVFIKLVILTYNLNQDVVCWVCTHKQNITALFLTVKQRSLRVSRLAAARPTVKHFVSVFFFRMYRD